MLAGTPIFSETLLFNPVKLAILLGWLYLCLYLVQVVQFHPFVPVKLRSYACLATLLLGPIVLVVVYVGEFFRMLKNAESGALEFVRDGVYKLLSLLRKASFAGRGKSRITIYDASGKSFSETYGSDRSSRHTLVHTEKIICEALDLKASDILIDPRHDSLYTVRLRVDGMLRQMEQLDVEKALAVINSVKAVSGMDIAEKRRPQDGAFMAKDDQRDYSFRVATAGVRGGEKLSIRVLGQNADLLDLRNIGFSGQTLVNVEECVARPSGMIMICGPTGSGKTTTLYAMLNSMDFFSRNVVTVEDPVEYVLPNTSQIEVNPKAEITFAKALRSILRQDPDVIVIGEIRDEETAEIAVKAANTGHLVLATMHCGSNAAALIRMMDLGIKPMLLTSALSMLISQRLVRKLCEHCKEPVEPDPVQMQIFKKLGIKDIEMYSATGCSRCDQTGYSGRMCIYDIMMMNDKIKQTLVSSAVSASELEKAGNMRTKSALSREGLLKVAAGLTTIQEVKRMTSDLG